MKLFNTLIISFFIMINTLWACTGDCLTCHPNLVPTIETDLRHKPMLTCINCHSADPNSMAECGSDCFACHPMSKINQSGITEHNVIQECRDCHMKLADELRSVPVTPTQSRQEPLREFLLNY
jgi:formate-dependent nitrite reductase cytochrome c552 subunit